MQKGTMQVPWLELLKLPAVSYQIAHMIAVAAEITSTPARMISICVASLSWFGLIAFHVQRIAQP